MSIKFREFENRDIDFVYHCKNDENLSRLIVGEFKPISKSEAIQWVEGCKGIMTITFFGQFVRMMNLRI